MKQCWLPSSTLRQNIGRMAADLPRLVELKGKPLGLYPQLRVLSGSLRHPTLCFDTNKVVSRACKLHNCLLSPAAMLRSSPMSPAAGCLPFSYWSQRHPLSSEPSNQCHQVLRSTSLTGDSDRWFCRTNPRFHGSRPAKPCDEQIKLHAIQSSKALTRRHDCRRNGT